MAVATRVAEDQLDTPGLVEPIDALEPVARLVRDLRTSRQGLTSREAQRQR
jgi:hypothetical protein